jgi:hypothetical protein
MLALINDYKFSKNINVVVSILAEVLKNAESVDIKGCFVYALL